MSFKSIALLSLLVSALPLHAAEWPPTKDATQDARVNGRVMETFHHFYTLLVDKRHLAKGDRFHWTGPAYELLEEMAARSILEALR